MWIESNSPELSVPYLWTEEKQSSEYFNPIYFGGSIETHDVQRLLCIVEIPIMLLIEFALKILN